MEIKGKVVFVGETVQVSEKFKKRDLVIEYAENQQYPETVKFEAHNERSDALDTVKVGDELEVTFNLKGRPWTNKDGVTSYFNTLSVWKINKLNSDLPF